MTIRECYETMGGDFDGFLKRIGNEKYIEMLSVCYLDAKEYFDLGDAIEKSDWKTAFMAAHTLKGVALNLGFPALAETSSTLTELLRPQVGIDQEKARELYKAVTDKDKIVRKALETYKAQKK